MDRRNFIKNSMLALSCSCLAGGAKIWYDKSTEGTILEGLVEGIPLKREYLTEKYKNKNELPKKIRLAVCSLCQLNCVKCFVRRNINKPKNGCGLGYLPFKDFKKFVDDNNFEEIELADLGEIFLNPDLLDIVKYSYKKNIGLTAITGANLNYLPDDMAEALVKYKFKKLVVSIDGATSDTYSIYRRGGDFNTVIRNIKKINYYKKKYNSSYPILTYKFILFGHNEHEIDKAKLLASKLNMEIKFDINYDSTYSPVKNVELVKQKTGIDTSLSSVRYYANCYRNDNKTGFFCKELWTSPQINWDGKVLGCSNNIYKNFGGNAFKDGLLKALNHPKMIYAKNMLTDVAYPIESIPCTNCDTYKVVKEMKLKFEPVQTS